ncbi:MAG: ATP-binding protein [Proteobacteria bacterium]|nr:ATP-binding protein [Pseudomonadota bacterium]
MAKFRTKARAVDHLGQGQIADLPTAITELWKNGYDAYADTLSCDLYREGYKGLGSPIFTLSDDGTGMSKEDLLDKWIVLGTESKARGAQELTENDRLGKPPRIPLGEKGIGRLSVAYLGSPMLMLTKKKSHPCMMLFVDWRILSNYNLYLEDLDIPIRTLNRNAPIKDSLNALLSDFEENLNSDTWEEHTDLALTIRRTLKTVRFPEFILEDRLFGFFDDDFHGTMFIIFDPHPQLLELSIEGAWSSDVDGTVKYLRSSLNGITNAFKGEQQLFQASFNIHSDTGSYDLISKSLFFTHDDMFAADHWLSGNFNSEGEFKGRLQVFNQNFEVFFRPNRPPGKTPYGPLTIEFGFIEGDAKNTKLPREQFDILTRKGMQFGGIYIYRDGFRVLPYGRTEYDFLEFEERRSRSATYYQFSHRRLFGYIEISRERNPDLIDKAGREGFIANRADREFRRDLKEFFTDLSVRYFRTVNPGELPTSREEQLEEIKKINARILAAEKKKSKQSITKFKRELREYSANVVQLKTQTESLYERLKTDMHQPRIAYSDAARLVAEIRNNKMLIGKLRLSKPARISLTDSLKERYADYREKFASAMGLVDKCDELIAELQKNFSQDNLESEFTRRLKSYQSDLTSTLLRYKKRIENSIEPLIDKIKFDINDVSGAFSYDSGKFSSDDNEDTDYNALLSRLDSLYNEYLNDIQNKYGNLTDHLEGLDTEIDDDALVGWYKEEYEKIEKKVEAMHELSQLGMAIEIIDHQFNVLYAEVDQAIKFFKQFSDRNPDVKYNYNQLRQAFDHLETNHQLLTPLYRTSRRTRTEIMGSEISDYLKKFFSARFRRHRINFSTDNAFNEYKFFTFESVIKPVFINVINNALYWLLPVKERKIEIRMKDGKILILNSGAKIEDVYLEDIFTLFFSRRPGGRGIGLYLAKTNLHTIGYEIYATNDRTLNKLGGACFIIEPYEETDNEL